MRIITILVFLVFNTLSIHAQVVINEESAVSDIMSHYQALSSASNEIDGWRIQIMNTDDRRMMESARSRFAAMYPDITMKWEHVQPYYRVYIGAYKTKLELEFFLRELKEEFPRAIPLRAKIEKSELLN